MVKPGRARRSRGQRWLFAGGVLCVGIALIHVAVLVVGPAGYSYFGAGAVARRAAEGAWWPTVLTTGLAGWFAVWAWYGLAAAGAVQRKPPMLGLGVLAIGALFAVRGLSVIPQALALARGVPLPARYLGFSLGSLVAGVCFLLGAYYEGRRMARADLGLPEDWVAPEPRAADASAPRPELKQFGELRAEDFERHPAWIGCHTVDTDEPWYDETDEETFRPWPERPAHPSHGMLLVRATLTLSDGAGFPGFVTPAHEPDLGLMQPHVFVGDRLFGFWGGSVGIPVDGRQMVYDALGRPPSQVFPITFAAEPGLAAGPVSGRLEGFYRLRKGEHIVEH